MDVAKRWSAVDAGLGACDRAVAGTLTLTALRTLGPTNSSGRVGIGVSAVLDDEDF